LTVGNVSKLKITRLFRNMPVDKLSVFNIYQVMLLKKVDAIESEFF
jgi:hypothetical protein